jgi:hypothetical protein
MSEAGKGSKQRKTDPQKFSDGWDKTFKKVPKDANIHPSCAEPFCSCTDRCVQMEPIKPGDLHR